MRAAVVGGNGFIGSHVVDRLANDGWQVVVLDQHERIFDELPTKAQFIRGDASDPRILREALVGTDVVFHLAWSTIHESSMEDPVSDIKTNLVASVRLFQACQQAGASRVVFVSSGGTVYGPAHQVPIAEDRLLEPVSSYGITKLAAEKYLHMFHHHYGLDYAILRPSVPYGPRQNPLGRQGAVAVFLYRIGQGLPITIWGDGSTSRDYFFVGDLVEAMMRCAGAELNHHRIFNLGGGEGINLRELIDLIERRVGKEAIVEHLPARTYDAQEILMDTRRALKELSWEPKVGMIEGVERTWAWMQEAFEFA